MKYMRYLFLIFCLFILGGCHWDSTTSSSENADANKAFSLYTEEIFRSQVTSDSLTLNYTLSHPENYGIQTLPQGFCAATKTDSIYYENELARLHSFSRSDLSFDMQILYDTLEDTLQQNVTSESFSAFSHTLNPTTGIQAQLPILLAEFRFDSTEDLAQYFSLLKTMPTYFDYIASAEKEKISTKTLPCKETTRRTIQQCRDFLTTSGTQILDTSFSNRIQSLDFLSDEKKQKAIITNKSYIQQYVIPAYTNLISELETLLDAAPEIGNLCSYSKGKEYYSYLVKSLTGSSGSIPQLKQLMEHKLTTSYHILLKYAKENPSLFSSCMEPDSSARTTKEILLSLSKEFTKDFPACNLGKIHVKEVDDSLEDYLSPAFYLTPPLDDENENTIYLNNARHSPQESLWNTLAHEGIPGHLYQNVYFSQKNQPPLRYLLNYSGYSEGWASYVEIYSYQYTKKSAAEIDILQNNMIMSLCIYGLCDIGIHYENWGISELQNFLSPYGYSNADTAKSLYQIIVDDPASYLQYTVGYLELYQIKEEIKKQLGSDYSEKLFHQYILDVGPTSFDIISSNFSNWFAQIGCN